MAVNTDLILDESIIEEQTIKVVRKPLKKGSWKRDIVKNWQIYVIFLPVFLYFFIFHVLPLFGILIAFENYRPAKGVWESEWVGLDNFRELFETDEFGRAIKNTLIIGCFNLVIGFPAPIIFALLITSIKNKPFRRVCQTLSYMPNFVAAMVIATLMKLFFDEGGAITNILTLFGFENQNWFANDTPPAFWLIYAFTGAWQGFGYGSILYVAAITSLNENLYEAAAIDGANRWQQVFKITLPSILPTIIMMLTLNIGTMFMAGFDRILLLYNPSIYDVSDTLYTYTYSLAFGATPNWGLSSASGLLQSIVGTILIFGSNYLSKKVAKTSLF